MKQTIIAFVAALSITAAADLKVATVNMVHLVELHPTHESNKALVKSTNDDYKAKLDAKQDALKALAEEAKKIYDDMQNPMLSTAAKADFQKKLESLQQKGSAARQELLRADQHYREEMNDLETRLIKLETSDIRAKISAYAKEKGYDLILDATMAAYANDSLDVTDDILRAMKVDPAKRKTLKSKEKTSEGK